MIASGWRYLRGDPNEMKIMPDRSRYSAKIDVGCLKVFWTSLYETFSQVSQSENNLDVFSIQYVNSGK